MKVVFPFIIYRCTSTYKSCVPFIIYRYISTYKPYQYLLTKQADETIHKYITKGRSLKEFVKEIERLKTMAHEISCLPPYAPMHFYWIDCTKLHKVSAYILLNYTR